MELKTRDKSSIKVIDITGNLDSVTSTDLNTFLNDLIEDGINKILLNCKQMDYVSSAGLRVILAASKKLSPKDGVLRICQLNNMVQEVFDISGFSAIFDIAGTEEESLQKF